MTSPEERREAQIRAMVFGLDSTGRSIKNVTKMTNLDRLLAYFDETEPAVADAIRYGLTVTSDWKTDVYDSGIRRGTTFRINYPEGHPKQ
jgi:hypothetical protein